MHKVYFVCTKSHWEQNAGGFGVSHGVTLPDGTHIFHASTEQSTKGHRDHFSKLPGVTAFPGLLDPSPIGKARADLFPASLNVKPNDTMYLLAQKLIALSPVFDPDEHA